MDEEVECLWVAVDGATEKEEAEDGGGGMGERGEGGGWRRLLRRRSARGGDGKERRGTGTVGEGRGGV